MQVLFLFNNGLFGWLFILYPVVNIMNVVKYGMVYDFIVSKCSFKIILSFFFLLKSSHWYALRKYLILYYFELFLIIQITIN